MRVSATLGLLILLIGLIPGHGIQAAEPVKIASIYAFSGVAAESNRPSFEGAAPTGKQHQQNQCRRKSKFCKDSASPAHDR